MSRNTEFPSPSLRERVRVRVNTGHFAKKLRKDQTDAERKLWNHLRNRQLEGVKFRRQHAIGTYIADFCCPEKNLVVELDGGQHVIEAEKDRKRSTGLKQMGYQVIRFWDHEVLQEIDTVLEAIRLYL